MRDAKHQVLVVEDNEDAAEALATLVQLLGHEARTAHDGPDALAMVDDYRPDLALIDIGLPGMDGYELARRLRERIDLASAVLVALTGYGGEADRLRSQAAGFDRHMLKPVDFSALSALLSALPRR